MRKIFARTAASLALASAAIVPMSGVASAHNDNDSAGGGMSGSASSMTSVGGHDGVVTMGDARAAGYWMGLVHAGMH
ncbi:hypothetical protein [Streptomyces purpurogeneiscleroticus]|uniref:hypothetical protein n=1 Tax=Streptomyces purpurogeneiscleroticus TaxID=68259 RepID=UPI001CBC4F81|nr:hypothetical protein [Streptomyces purpurogeneiscleroticus]MBZ4019914.1 hypothetical protein [Streptomyces purpurogeneiscleroticus]